MKKNILIIFFICLSSVYAQQNLVLNPSFEDNFLPIQCGPNMGETFPITDWNYGSTLGTTDAISLTIGLNCINHPLNLLMTDQSPRTGNNYVGLLNVFSNTYKHREYIRGKLSENLGIGVRYKIQFYVCLGSVAGTNAGMNNIGLKFINDDLPIYSTSQALILQPDVNYTDSPIIDRNTWQLLSFEFIANSSGLDAFMIGNFFSDQDTNIQILYQGTWAVTYLLLEDVSIYALTPVINIVDEICQGDNLILPNISENGIEGTWSPPINNQETTTYIFTPNDTEFDVIEKTVVVKPIVTPIFAEIGPFCDEIPNIILPTVSINEVGGTWSPAVNNQQTTTYTFTPNEPCAEQASLTIIIDETPVFDLIEPFCDYDVNFTLPTVSKNGIEGTWSPEFDPYNSKTYTFTRNSDYCTKQVSLDVVVHNQIDFDLIHYCSDLEYFVELDFNNSYSPNVINYDWKVNNTSVQNNTSRLNLSNYFSLLNDINKVEVTITDDNGCSRTNEVSILGKYFCKIQKGISPNEDGLNDYFDLASFGGVNLKIFNRHGKEVYKKSNYKVEWSGQSNKGNLLPTGTYFYQIETNVGEQLTGWIQLIY